MGKWSILAAGWLVLVLAVGCSRSSLPSPTPAASPTVARNTPSATPSTTPSVSATPARLVLKPPDLVLRASSGTQTATIGPFFWVLESGFAGETTAPGLVPPTDSPLPVGRGETLQFSFAEGTGPASVKLAVYPQEGNYEPIAPSPDAPKGFVVKTEPVTSAEPTLDGNRFSWTVGDLAPGAYFVRVEAQWPQHPKNPRPDKLPQAVYAFWIEVR